jgi:hypothetical protein
MVCRGTVALHVISLALTAALAVQHLQRVSSFEQSSVGLDESVIGTPREDTGGRCQRRSPGRPQSHVGAA